MSTQFSFDDETVTAPHHAKVAAEIDALPKEKVMGINIPVSKAVSTVLGALPGILLLRPSIARLVEFDLERFDKLEDYAKALVHADSRCHFATTEDDRLEVFVRQGTESRNRLRKDAVAMAGRGIIPVDSLRDCRGRKGYKHLATDLQILVSVMRTHWEAIALGSVIKQDEIEIADRLASHILRIVGMREQQALADEKANDHRNRAFTLFWRSYDLARRAVIYLRWEAGDADVIAPALYYRCRSGK